MSNNQLTRLYSSFSVIRYSASKPTPPKRKITYQVAALDQHGNYSVVFEFRSAGCHQKAIAAFEQIKIAPGIVWCEVRRIIWVGDEDRESQQVIVWS